MTEFGLWFLGFGLCSALIDASFQRPGTPDPGLKTKTQDRRPKTYTQWTT